MEADEKILAIVEMVKNHLKKLLHSDKTTCHHEIAIEINVSQGAVGDVYLKTQTRGKIC